MISLEKGKASILLLINKNKVNKQKQKHMAIRKMTDGVSQWKNTMPFPKDNYILNCLEETFAPSSGGNPMITRKFEIVSPSVVECGELKVSVAGLTIVQYRVLKNKDKETGEWDTKKSDKSWGDFRDELLNIGVDQDMEIDDENPPLLFKGKKFQGVVYGKKDVSRKPLTPEQIRKGIKQGDPIKDQDGNDIVSYQLQIEKIVGAAS